MAIQFVGSLNITKGTTVNANVNINLTALTGGIDTAARAGDLVIIANQTADTNSAPATINIKDPSGTAYTTAGSQLYANDTTDINLLVGYKVMGSTPDATATFAQSTSVVHGGFATAYVFRGVDPNNPMDVAAVTAQGGNSANVAPASITPVTAGAVICIAGATGHQVGAVNVGGTSYLSNVLAQNYNSTTDCSAAMGHVAWTSGAYSPAAWTLAGSALAHCWAAVTMALRPAPGGGNIKVWNGSAWTAKPVKFWNGSAWITKPMKRWNGSAWITLPY